jgi:diguanylate cyclase (GGDEF)-like protein
MAVGRDGGLRERRDLSVPVVTAAARGRLSLFWAGLLFAFPPALFAQGTPLPVLHTVRQAHLLPDEEARRGYPVHLDQAQVTFYDAHLGAMFLMDATDGIFADIRGMRPPDLRAGDIVSVEARSGPGKVNPVLLDPKFRLLRHGELPAAPLVSFDRILTGAWDSRWISMEGVVRAVRKPSEITAYAGEPAFGSSNVLLTLASGPDLIDVITEAPAGSDYRTLIDARVRLRAAVGSRFNQRNQVIGVHVYMPELSYVQVLEAPPPDPFALPVTETANVMRRSLFSPGHRVRVRGVVTWASGPEFSVMDAVHGIFVRSDRPSGVRVGDLVDVVGFPSMGGYTSVLEDALVRRMGVGRPPPPVAVSAAEALTGLRDAEPIEVEGDLLYLSRSPSEQDLVLTDHGINFSAVLPVGARQPALSLEPGARLRLSGICFIEVTPDKTPQGFKILLRSPADAVILQQPSWWTARHALVVSLLLSTLVFVVIAWNVVLRRRVRGQTQVIRAQLEEAHALREEAESANREKSASLENVLSLQQELLAAQEELRFQATHDGLTGLRNRAALLDLLHRELERGTRTHSSIGILMLDIDHFKPINDTWGHPVGDAVLRQVATRLTGATRSYDMAGRYGGEEFLVILPESDAQATWAGAERIRAAIAGSPFTAPAEEIPLTISIGATVAQAGASEAELLSIADSALYQAKREGRNRTVLWTEGNVSQQASQSRESQPVRG